MVYKMLIAVDSGHGMETPGKRTPPLKEDIILNGITLAKKGTQIHEKTWNRAVADKLMEALVRCGFDVLDVAPGLTDIPLAERYEKANKAKASAFISKHYNAIGETKWWTPGYSVAFISQYASSATKLLAASIQKLCALASGFPNDGVQKDIDYLGYNVAVLRHTNMPAVLTETGFMDVWEQAKLMVNPEFIRADADATCKGICNYFGVDYVPEQPVKKKIYSVQIGAYEDYTYARQALDAAIEKGYTDAYITTKEI